MKYLFLLLFLLPSLSYSQKAVPELWGTPVHDEAGVLSSNTISLLESQLKAFEDSTSNQIAILIVKSLDGEVLEEYSLRVAHDEWKLGQENKDNGVLLLIAIDDRKMRIEVGEGLEGPLPDAICNQIIRNEITPNFRRQDFDAGVLAGVDAIMKAIGGEYIAEEFDSSSDLTVMSIGERIFMGLFVFGILGIFVTIGLFTPGCAGWGLYGFLLLFFATFPMVIFGMQGGITTLAIYAIGFPILKLLIGNSEWGKKILKKMNSSSGGRSGGGWSSGGGSWGGGGGGFSGGGGSFGGGGSSGSW